MIVADPTHQSNNDDPSPLCALVHPWDLPAGKLGESIGIGNVDLVLSCRRGLFSSRFLHVSRTPSGEVFGSSRSDDSVTVAIDHCELSPKHCQVAFDSRSLQYSVVDLGSESGTWMRLRSDKGLPIHTDQLVYLNGVLLRIEPGTPLKDGIEALDEFLKCYDLIPLRPFLLNIFRIFQADASLESLHNLASVVKARLIEDDSVPIEAMAVLFVALVDVPLHFLPVEEKSCSLRLVECADTSKVYAEIRWSGGYLCPIDTLDYSVGEPVKEKHKVGREEGFWDTKDNQHHHNTKHHSTTATGPKFPSSNQQKNNQNHQDRESGRVHAHGDRLDRESDRNLEDLRREIRTVDGHHSDTDRELVGRTKEGTAPSKAGGYPDSLVDPPTTTTTARRGQLAENSGENVNQTSTGEAPARDRCNGACAALHETQPSHDDSSESVSLNESHCAVNSVISTDSSVSPSFGYSHFSARLPHVPLDSDVRVSCSLEGLAQPRPNHKHPTASGAQSVVQSFNFDNISISRKKKKTDCQPKQQTDPDKEQSLSLHNGLPTAEKLIASDDFYRSLAEHQPTDWDASEMLPWELTSTELDAGEGQNSEPVRALESEQRSEQDDRESAVPAQSRLGGNDARRNGPELLVDQQEHSSSEHVTVVPLNVALDISDQNRVCYQLINETATHPSNQPRDKKRRHELGGCLATQETGETRLCGRSEMAEVTRQSHCGRERELPIRKQEILRNGKDIDLQQKTNFLPALKKPRERAKSLTSLGGTSANESNDENKDDTATRQPERHGARRRVASARDCTRNDRDVGRLCKDQHSALQLSMTGARTSADERLSIETQPTGLSSTGPHSERICDSGHHRCAELHSQQSRTSQNQPHRELLTSTQARFPSHTRGDHSLIDCRDRDFAALRVPRQVQSQVEHCAPLPPNVESFDSTAVMGTPIDGMSKYQKPAMMPVGHRNQPSSTKSSLRIQQPTTAMQTTTSSAPPELESQTASSPKSGIDGHHEDSKLTSTRLSSTTRRYHQMPVSGCPKVSISLGILPSSKPLQNCYREHKSKRSTLHSCSSLDSSLSSGTEESGSFDSLLNSCSTEQRSHKIASQTRSDQSHAMSRDDSLDVAVQSFLDQIDNWLVRQEEFSSHMHWLHNTLLTNVHHCGYPSRSTSQSTASLLRQQSQVLLSTTKRFHAGRLLRSSDDGETFDRAMTRSGTSGSVSGTSSGTAPRTCVPSECPSEGQAQFLLNAQACPSVLPVDNMGTPVPPMGLMVEGVPMPIPSLALYGTGSAESVGGLPGALFLSPNKPLVGEKRQLALQLVRTLTNQLIVAGIENVRVTEIANLKGHYNANSRQESDKNEDIETTIVNRLQLVSRIREWLVRLKEIDLFEKVEQHVSRLGHAQKDQTAFGHERLNSVLRSFSRDSIASPDSDPSIFSALRRPIYRLPKACGAGINLVIKYIGGEYQFSIAEAGLDSPSTIESLEHLFVKLRPHVDQYLIGPGDVIRIGNLEFAALRFNTGVGGHQGFRHSMEDEELAIQDLFGVGDGLYCSYFAVYDGHGGRQCAEFVHARLHHCFRHQLFLLTGRLGLTTSIYRAVYDALFRAFTHTDRIFLRQQEQQNRRSGPGCAAIVVVILGDTLWAANAGDARAVLCRNGAALSLSRDHKPTRDDECRRIEASGGFIKSRRVLGRLAVSRAFGDLEYKNVASGKPPLVVSDPEIRMQKLTADDEFLLLACDGLFDVFTSQEAVDFIRRRLAAMPPGKQEPQRVVEDLIREAIDSRRSRDNVTAILVAFKRTIAGAAVGQCPSPR